MTGFLARSLAQQVAVASGISNLARAMTTQASAAAAGQSVPESEASTSQPSSETAIPAPSEPQSSSPSPPSEASNSPSSSPAPSQPASKRQPDMMETLLGKLKFNKTLKHDDDLSAEIGIVNELARRQELDFQLLLAKKRLEQAQHLEYVPKGASLEQLLGGGK